MVNRRIGRLFSFLLSFLLFTDIFAGSREDRGGDFFVPWEEEGGAADAGPYFEQGLYKEEAYSEGSYPEDSYSGDSDSEDPYADLDADPYAEQESIPGQIYDPYNEPYAGTEEELSSDVFEDDGGFTSREAPAQPLPEEAAPEAVPAQAPSPWEDQGEWNRFIAEIGEIRTVQEGAEEDPLHSPQVGEAALALREAMKGREASCLVTLTFPDTLLSYVKEHQQDFYSQILSQALSETGRGEEGDYLTYHFSSCRGDVSLYTLGEKLTVILEYSLTYYDSPGQEAVLDGLLPRLERELGLLEEISPEEKVGILYRYLISHTSYDTLHRTDPSYGLKYSAYAALVQGEALCQGLALLFYRMCLDVGVPCRILTGMALGEPHMWNIVRLGESYYHVDLTFEEGRDPQDFSYFLRGEDAMEKTHARVGLCAREDFLLAYPVSRGDYQPGSAPWPALILTPSRLTLYAVGEEEESAAKLSVSLQGAGDSLLQVKSLDPSVAAVTPEGEVRAVEAGRTQVKVRLLLSGVPVCTASCRVTVKKPVLRVPPLTLRVGEKRRIPFTVIPEGEPSFTVKNEKIATVKKGVVKAKKAGRTKLKVRCHGLRVVVPLVVTV